MRLQEILLININGDDDDDVTIFSGGEDGDHHGDVFQFQVVNHHLLKDLTHLGLWNDNMKMRIMANNGSVQV